MKLYQDQLARILKFPGDHNVQDLDQRVETSLQYYNHTKIRRYCSETLNSALLTKRPKKGLFTVKVEQEWTERIQTLVTSLSHQTANKFFASDFLPG